jgi:hypothetical protein
MPATEAPAPESTVDVPSIPEKGLKHRRIIVMIALTIITFGLYYPTWFLRRRRALNRLDSPRKIPRRPSVMYLGFFAVQFVVEFVSFPAQPVDTIGEAGILILMFVQLAIVILMVVQSFIVKDIPEDHLRGSEPTIGFMVIDSPRLSGLLTFFFSIYYLQYVINQEISSLQPTRVVESV